MATVVGCIPKRWLQAILICVCWMVFPLPGGLFDVFLVWRGLLGRTEWSQRQQQRQQQRPRNRQPRGVKAGGSPHARPHARLRVASLWRQVRFCPAPFCVFRVTIKLFGRPSNCCACCESQGHRNYARRNHAGWKDPRQHPPHKATHLRSSSLAPALVGNTSQQTALVRTVTRSILSRHLERFSARPFVPWRRHVIPCLVYLPYKHTSDCFQGSRAGTAASGSGVRCVSGQCSWQPLLSQGRCMSLPRSLPWSAAQSIFPACWQRQSFVLPLRWRKAAGAKLYTPAPLARAMLRGVYI